MNLGTLLLDTNPTDSDSPYDRLLRLRKWILAISLIGALIDLNLFRAEAASAVIRVAVLPDWLILSIICWALGYLLLHYAMLGWQSLSTYDIMFQKRRHAQVNGRQMVILSRLHSLDEELASLENRQVNMTSSDKSKRRGYLNHERKLLDDEFKRLEEKDPYERGGFLLMEFLIDVLKTLPAPIIGSVVFFRLVW